MTTTHAPDVATRVSDYFNKHPNAMTMMAARELEIPEADVLGHLPTDRVRRLSVDNVQAMIEALDRFSNVHVIVSNGASTIECIGDFGGFSVSGDFLNVQSGSLDMHIRYRRIASAFALRKPSHMSGVPTLSIQFFDTDGAAAFKAFLTFGQAAPDDALCIAFETYCTEFAAD